jgi:hypothetical protein
MASPLPAHYNGTHSALSAELLELKWLTGFYYPSGGEFERGTSGQDQNKGWSWQDATMLPRGNSRNGQQPG